MTLVLMQFGDGSHKQIDVEAEEEHEALADARDWVNDNAWFELADDSEKTEELPIRDLRRP